MGFLGLNLDENILLFTKALILILAGILLGFVIRKLLFKFIDSYILKKLFAKDVSSHETAKMINKIICLIIQIIIILLFVDYAFILLHFDLLSKAFSYILNTIPQIIIFIVIVLSGLLIAKLVSNLVRSRKIEKKEEIALVVEFIIVAAFMLTALEFVGIKATALIELFKALLYVIAAVIIILIIKPEFFENQRKKIRKG